MAKRDLINITDLTQEEVGEILDLADDMVAHPEKYYEECAHRKSLRYSMNRVPGRD